jgi:hypothetical protein
MSRDLARQLESELAAGFSYHSLGAVVQHCDKELSRAEALDGEGGLCCRRWISQTS